MTLKMNDCVNLKLRFTFVKLIEFGWINNGWKTTQSNEIKLK